MIKPIYNFFHNHYHRRYHGVYAHAKQLFIFDMVLLSFAILLLGAGVYLTFWKPGPASEVDVVISLGTERIESGDKVKLSIEYTNRSKLNLHNAVLAVRLPRGFFVDYGETKNFDQKNHTVQIGDLPPGSHGNTTIEGRLWTNVNETEKIISTLSFIPEDKKTTDQAAGVYLLTLSGSVLKTNLVAPNKSYADQKIALKVDLQNDSTEKLSDIRVKLNGKESEQPIELLHNATTTFAETILAPAKGGTFGVVADVRIVVNGQSFSQFSTRKNIELLSPRISVTARVDNAPTYVEPGSTIPVKIVWKNEGQFPLNNQKVILKTTPGIINLAATAKENLLTTKDGNLIIDKKSRTALADGKPGNGDTFELKLIVNDSFDLRPVGVNIFNVRAAFEAEAVGAEGQIFTVDGAGSNIPLAAEAFLRTEARYYTDEGDQLGRGPIPPQAGKTTKYWIFATLFDKVNPLRANRLILNLAPGVTFTGKQSVTIGPELIYNPNAKTVSWIYDGAVPADSESGFYFEVQVTPGNEQIGYILNLLTGATYSGIDDEVGKQFNIKVNNTSNILPKTDKGSKNGAVVLP